MTNPAGNVPDTFLPPGGAVETELLPAAQPELPEIVSWDRVVNEVVECRGCDFSAGIFQLTDMVAPIPSDRLVVSVPYLRWTDGAVIRVADVLVRFTHRMVLDRGGAIEAVHGSDHHSTFTQMFATHQLDGHFIDIIAPTSVGEHAEITYSVLGVLALALGDAAIGDVAHIDHIYPQMVDGQILGMHETNVMQRPVPSAISGTLRMPIPLRGEELRECDRLLTLLLENEVIREDTMLALRWFERALRAGSEVDRYMAAVIGIESIVTNRSKRLGFVSPIADLLGDARVAELLAPLRDDYPDDHVNRLLSRLRDKNPSFKDRFGNVVEGYGLDEQTRATFRAAAEARGPILHGSVGTLGGGLADGSRKLLRELLLAEFRGVDGEAP
jgi:hypothetical protein